MKLQAALATALATKCLSSTIFGVEAKSPALSESKKQQLQVIQSISKFDSGDGKKKRFLKKAIAKQQARRLSEPQLRNGKSETKPAANTAGLDLGILGSTGAKATIPKLLDGVSAVLQDREDSTRGFLPTGRHLEEEYDYGAYIDELIQYLENILTRPFGYAIEYSCSSLEYYNACTTCEVVIPNDPVTGLPTGTYQLNMDCPNLPEAYNATYFGEWFDKVCTPGYFCDGCDPVCSACSINRQTSRFAGNDCQLTQEVSDAIGLGEAQEYLQSLVGDLAEVEELVEDLSVLQRPMAAMMGHVCEFLNEQGYCSTCAVTDVGETGMYNIEFNCPRIPESSESADMFASLQQSCNANLCESCTIDEEILFFSMQNCSTDNPDFEYTATDAPDEVIIFEDPVVQVPDEAPTVLEEEEEEEEEPVEEMVTVDISKIKSGAKSDELSSGADSPKSTLLALVLLGASWCWMAA
eukprot:CAMPEP_0116131512 /NCGR_PEP_ID=MMETSP0329-20121206/9047_1 /TAXON_ID=697910 /ORGANISM="Pseudo-nitzschia arenysensis, Strain B593" /LENGTH=466 /DNA_ID=CAMNT_0003625951 /DNA_START=38 /DNA_END=1438 /DNA_ORIENTATION=+